MSFYLIGRVAFVSYSSSLWILLLFRGRQSLLASRHSVQSFPFRGNVHGEQGASSLLDEDLSRPHAAAAMMANTSKSVGYSDWKKRKEDLAQWIQ